MKKFYTQLLLSALSFLCNLTIVNAQVNKNDSLALVDLYNSTNGPGWFRHYNWLTGPVSQWYGITVTDNRVSQIILSNNWLHGTIPSSLGNIRGLTILYLDQNNLTGNIPPELGNLVRLTGLKLSYDLQLSGSIPSSLGNLINLNELALSDNHLTGNIPPELGNLIKLRELFLDYNQLTGTIPPELGNLTKLKKLMLDANILSGTIPSSLGNLTDLDILYLYSNNLSGSIPSSFGNLLNLTQLYLSNNQLSGSIPPELYNLSMLKDLELYSNQLNGSIPPEIENLSNLKTLYLQGNQFTGRIPGNLGRLQKMQRLNLSNNGFSTSQNYFPIRDLIELEMDNNHFTFDGIEILANKSYCTYAPQDKIPLHLNNNNKFSVYAGGTLSNNTYYWFKDGSLVATIQGDSTFTPTETGSYTVRINNSIATDLTLKTGSVYFNALSSSNENSVVLSKMEFSNNLSVYPNPAKSLVTVTFNLTGNCIVKLMDNSGKLLQIKTINTIKDGNKLQLDVSRYVAGIYFVSVTDEHNKTEVLKLNKE